MKIPVYLLPFSQTSIGVIQPNVAPAINTAKEPATKFNLYSTNMFSKNIKMIYKFECFPYQSYGLFCYMTYHSCDIK